MNQTQTATQIEEMTMPLTDQAPDEATNEATDDHQDKPKRRFGLRRKPRPEPEPLPTDLCLVDHESGEVMDCDTSHLEADDLFAGNVLTFQNESGKRHYLIQEVQGQMPSDKNGAARDEAPEDQVDQGPLTVRLAPAKSNIHKSFLLLAILAVTWFAVSWLIRLVF